MNVTGLWRGCWRHRKAVSLLAAERLSATEAAAVTAHVERCSRCRRRCIDLRELAKLGEDLARTLPELEPPISLTRRWERAILEPSEDPDPVVGRPSRDFPLAWGALVGLWAMILFFRWSAPGVVKPEVATAPVSWGEVRMALGAGAREALPAVVPAPARETPVAIPPAPGPRGDAGNGADAEIRRQV